MRVGSACVLAAFVLGGCVTLPGATPPAAVPATNAKDPCKAFVNYSQVQDRELSIALIELQKAAPPGWLVLVARLKDYHTMREACRTGR